MDQVTNTPETNQDSKCNGIEPYLQYGRKNDRVTHYYILDNNVLSDLAKLAREEQTSFKELMTCYKGTVFIMPQMVLEEAIRNLPGQQRVDEMYLAFYRFMSELEIPIYLESVEYNYQIFAEGYGSREEAFRQYKEIAQKSVSNIVIQNALRNAKSCEDIEVAYSQSLKDAGERFIFLYAHAMLQDKVNKISILSNEIKGVYNVWKANMRKGELLELVKVTSHEEYCEKLRPVSYNCILVDSLKKNPTLTSEQRKSLLQIMRDSSIIGRNVYYSQKSCNLVDTRADMNNEEFLNFIEKQDDYKLAF
ncbi:hypothetical protein [Bacillus cereus]|uniref:PIN domain-containing protein n=1 Tax=Bacillus cereus TaxID=1396 RepID=A0A0G8ED60_BACCE|nr:hypothetical protein [Bacillus cereus]KLA22229.1 hypothetical protein B4077_3175 [Bacillus cereus]